MTKKEIFEAVATFSIGWGENRFCVRCNSPLAYTYYRFGKRRQGYCNNGKCSNFGLAAVMAWKHK